MESPVFTHTAALFQWKNSLQNWILLPASQQVDNGSKNVDNYRRKKGKATLAAHRRLRPLRRPGKTLAPPHGLQGYPFQDQHQFLPLHLAGAGLRFKGRQLKGSLLEASA